MNEKEAALDRMLDDLKTTVGSDTEMASDGRNDSTLVSSFRTSSYNDRPDSFVEIFRSSSRNEGRSGSRSGSRAGQVEDGGHVKHTLQEYRTPDNQTHVVTEKYEYDTGDTSKSKHYQKKVMKSTYSNFNNMSAGSLEDPPARPSPPQISPPAPVDTKGTGTLTNGAPTTSYEVDDMIADDHKPGEVRRIVWRNRFEKTYETQDSSQPPPSMTIEEESRRRDLHQRHHTSTSTTTSTLSSPPQRGPASPRLPQLQCAVILPGLGSPPHMSPGSQSWKEPIPMPTPPQLSPREPGVAYIYTYGGQQGGTGVQPLPPLNYVNVPGPQSVPPSDGAPSPTPSSQLQTQPIIYHYSYHYTIQPGQQPPDGVPLPPGGTLPSSTPALQGPPGSQTHMHVSHHSHTNTQCNHPDHHSGQPGHQCNHPDHKGPLNYLCNHPDHKGHPVYQCNHPDHKSQPDYLCNHPDHKGQPVLQCSHPDHKTQPSYLCNHPDHKGHPVYQCNHPDHQVQPGYVCNHPDHKGHPVYQCGIPDHKGYFTRPGQPGQPPNVNYNIHSYTARSTTSTVNRNETTTLDPPGGPRPRDGPGSPSDDPVYPRKPVVPVRSSSPSSPDSPRSPGQPGPQGINITINKTTTTRTVHGYPGSPDGSDVPPVTSTPYSSRGRSISPEPRTPNIPHHITYHTHTHVSRDPNSDSLDRVRRPRNDTLPFPDTSPIKGNDKTKIPRRVDDLMTSFSDSEDGGPPGGPPNRHPRRGDPADHEPLLPHNNQVAVRADADAKAVAEAESKRDLTKNKAGPPVYYPPGHELFHETMHTMTLKEGGRRGKAKWRMEKSSGYKESSSSSESKGGVAMVPVCLPLCCGAACVIM